MTDPIDIPTALGQTAMLMFTLAAVGLQLDKRGVDPLTPEEGTAISEFVASSVRSIDRDPNTAWVAYYHDMSGFGIFQTEIEALRAAVGTSQAVMAVTLPCPDFGELIREKNRPVAPRMGIGPVTP